jgi:hypothetical protein
MLVYHGRSKDACEWVIKMFKDDPLCKDNLTTQSWIKQCEEYLQLLKEADARNNL